MEVNWNDTVQKGISLSVEVSNLVQMSQGIGLKCSFNCMCPAYLIRVLIFVGTNFSHLQILHIEQEINLAIYKFCTHK